MSNDFADELFAGENYADAPGAMLAVVDRGGLAWQRSVGRPRLTDESEFNGNTRFRLCSVSKSMGAQVMVALAQAGKLDLEAAACTYLPELRALPHRPTVRQLLAMQSGVREVISLAYYATAHDALPIKTAQFLELLFAQRGLNFEPGATTLYSNSNYLLLQAIVERVTAAPVCDSLQKYVFGPAGMRDAAFVRGPVLQEYAIACAYERTPDNAWQPYEYLAELDLCGAIVASFDDAVAWLRWSSVEGSGALSTLAAGPARSDGTHSHYALGLQVQTLSGRRLQGHSGGIGPWATDIFWLPDDEVGVVVLANRNDINWYERSRELAVRWLRLDPDPGATPRLIRPSPPDYGWVAQYVNEHLGVSYRVQGSADEWRLEERRFGSDGEGRFVRTLGVDPIVVTPESVGPEGGPPLRIEYQHGNELWTCALESPSNVHAEAACGHYVTPEMPGGWSICTNESGGLQATFGLDWPAGKPIELRSVTPQLWRGYRDSKPIDVHVWLDVAGDSVAAIEVSDARVRRLRMDRVRPGH